MKWPIPTLEICWLFGNYSWIIHKNSHFEHTWLKEGWATYIEAVWCEENISEDEMRYQMLDNAKAYIKETNSKYMRPIVTRVYDSSWAMFDRHTYPGGAWRLHMLRHLLGDESFWAGVRKYVKDYSGKTVETEDFRKYLEDASGLNLNKFFDQVTVFETDVSSGSILKDSPLSKGLITILRKKTKLRLPLNKPK
jgi:aminopeptidase N